MVFGVSPGLPGTAFPLMILSRDCRREADLDQLLSDWPVNVADVFIGGVCVTPLNLNCGPMAQTVRTHMRTSVGLWAEPKYGA